MAAKSGILELIDLAGAAPTRALDGIGACECPLALAETLCTMNHSKGLVGYLNWSIAAEAPFGESVSARFWTDIRSLLRGIRFVVCGPRVIASACRDTSGILEVYDQVVLPIIDGYMQDAGTKKWLTESLRSYSATACWIIKEYTRMADIAFLADLAVLGAAFNRLYDDLFDEFDRDDELGARLTELFRMGEFRPANDAEQVLYELFGRIKHLLDRPADDPIFNAAAAVNAYQVRSCSQYDVACPEALLKTARGKGGYAVVVMFGLMRESMSVDEIDLLLRLGELIQMIDDYQDREQDVEKGIRTIATEGRLRLSDIADLLRSTYPDFCRFYQRKRAIRFWALLYIMTVLTFVCENWPRCRVKHYPATEGVGWPLKILLAPDGGYLSSEYFGASRPVARDAEYVQREFGSGQW